jgi:uncharacterized protein (DUF983 family)
VTAPPAVPPRPRTLFARAIRLRCPVCGGHPILLSWFTVAPSCPTCGFHLDRDEPGYWLGSYTVNLFATEGAWVAFFVTGLVVTWPGVPWGALLWGGLAVGALTPVLLFPFAKTVYLAIDLCFRPPEPGELTAPAERRFVRPPATGHGR